MQQSGGVLDKTEATRSFCVLWALDNSLLSQWPPQNPATQITIAAHTSPQFTSQDVLCRLSLSA